MHCNDSPSHFEIMYLFYNEIYIRCIYIFGESDEYTAFMNDSSLLIWFYAFCWRSYHWHQW